MVGNEEWGEFSYHSADGCNSLGWSQEPGAWSRSPTWRQLSMYSVVFCCFCQSVSRELGHCSMLGQSLVPPSRMGPGSMWTYFGLMPCSTDGRERAPLPTARLLRNLERGRVIWNTPLAQVRGNACWGRNNLTDRQIELHRAWAYLPTHNPKLATYLCHFIPRSEMS